MSLKLDTVIEGLRIVREPKTGKDLMALGQIRDLKIEGDNVSLKLVLKGPDDTKLEQQVKDVLMRVGATGVDVRVEGAVPKASAGIEKHGVPGVKNIIAVSSGKGGVGKSTVSANLACALASIGAKVGLLDCDIYGPNIPTMMGVDEPPMARQDDARGELILPLHAHGVKVMSMGLLTKGDQPVIWRGPMLHSVVSQFLLKVDWSASADGKTSDKANGLDYLIVDMPPGTGDVQLSLTQLVPVSGAVIVTTPQEVSAQDVRKAILMFEKVGVPVLGIVENMSFFIPPDMPEKKYRIFGEGAGQLLAEKFRIPLLAQLPIQPSVCTGGDTGKPVVVSDPQSAISRAFLDLARTVSNQVSLAQKPAVNIGAF